MALTSEDGIRNATTTRSGFVLVSTYSWMCITIGAMVVRLGQGLIFHKVAFGPDDATILVATVIYLGTTISWQYAANGGLGKDSTDLSAEDVTLFFKAIYAAQLFGIFAMAFAKLSSAFLVERVAPQSQIAKIILFGMTAAWTVFSAFAMTFQCGLPRWTVQTLQCHNGGLLITAIVLNMVTDLVLAAWIVPTFWSLSLDKEKRMTATMLFGSRAIVPLVAGAQAWAAAKVARSSDPTHDVVNLVFLTQAVTGLSLIVASIPRIKRFLGSGGSGMACPQIQPTEYSLSHRSISRQESYATQPKLVPSGSGKFTVTISSKRRKDKKKEKPPTDWQGLMTMGVKEDDHTSTSSLFDHEEREGVNVQREVTVLVEDSSARHK